MVTIEPIIRCACSRMLRFEWKDLEAKFFERAYHLYCPGCKNTNTLTPEFAKLFQPKDETPPDADNLEPKPAEEKPAKAPPAGREKIEKALEAEKAVRKHKTKAAAARVLGVSVQTVSNRLGYLPVSEEVA